jgi:hypothetical protein
MLLLSYYSDNRMTAKGLTRQQREEVKQVVFDHYIQKISISNTIDKIEQLMHVKLGESWILRLRGQLKESAKQEISKFREDRYAYIQKYLDRIHAVEQLEKKTWDLCNSTRNEFVHLRCISELRELQVLLTDLYQNLPLVTASYVPELEQPSHIIYSDDNRKV